MTTTPPATQPATDDAFIAELIAQNRDLPEGIFVLAKPLVLAPGYALKGAGTDKTTLRFTPSDPDVPDPRSGIVLLASGCIVSDLTADCLAACTNGIVADGIEQYAILDCRVLCQNDHTYSIWSHLSSVGLIADNVVAFHPDGSTPCLEQEFIELFGGRNIEVRGNVLIGAGHAGINLYQDLGSVLDNVNIHNNTMIECGYGFFASTAENCRITNATVANNTIVKSSICDIKVAGKLNSVINMAFTGNAFDTWEINTNQCATAKVTIKLKQ